MDHYLAIQEAQQDAEYRAESIRLLALAMSYKYPAVIDYHRVLSILVTLDDVTIDLMLDYYDIEAMAEVTF